MDISLTRQLLKAANLLGIKLLDHLVVGDGRYASLLENGVLGRLEAEEQLCAEGER
jgi:DNA repair protein RadC